jgi:hypothetical protein
MGTVGAVVLDQNGNLAGKNMYLILSFRLLFLICSNVSHSVCSFFTFLTFQLSLAGTSSGGTCNKWVGRIGGVPCIGSATLASSFVAVSGTGTGEAFIRACSAARLADEDCRARYIW